MINKETIKFDCPHCAQSIEAPAEMIGMEIECPGCGKKVTVQESFAAAELKASNQWKHAGAGAKPHNYEKLNKLRETADGFATVAKIFFAIGFLGVMFFIFTVMGQEVAMWLLYAAIPAFGVAFWFYLLAQTIHIRAALEKSNHK